MRLRDFRALSFDCYGTLIDWEKGIWTALAALRRLGLTDRDAVLRVFAARESTLQAAHPGAGYSDILAGVHRGIADEFGLPCDQELDRQFGRSLQHWPPFADSQPALRYLGRYFRLIILSNVSRSGFAASAEHLGIQFDAVYTAEDIGSYKPDSRNFRYLIEHCQRDFGIGREHLLHVAQSLYHDHVPAVAAGLSTAWIDRQQGRSGATHPVGTRPDVRFVFPDLAALVACHRAER